MCYCFGRKVEVSLNFMVITFKDTVTGFRLNRIYCDEFV